MNAERARMIAEVSAQEVDISPITKQIEAAAKKGLREVIYYKSMSDLQAKKLKVEGFEVEYNYDRGDSFYRITW